MAASPINKLQNSTGNKSFNNLFKDAPTIADAFGVDFVTHAASMGANAVFADNAHALAEAFKAAKAADKTTVIVMNVDAYEGWTTKGHTWWEVGTPEVSEHESVREKHAEIEAVRVKQRRGV